MNQELMLLNEMDANLEWFKQHLSELKEGYNNLFVAIKDEKVIASKQDLKKLVTDLKAKNQNPAQVLIQFISKTPIIL